MGQGEEKIEGGQSIEKQGGKEEEEERQYRVAERIVESKP